MSGLRKPDDQRSWKEFYRVYGRIVRDFALRAGLSPCEADEVVQETAIGVARHLPQFRYNRSICRFKTWLLNQSAWRIKDQFRKRARAEAGEAGIGEHGLALPSDVEAVPDPSGANMELLFETEWKRAVSAEALERVKARIPPRLFQIFDLYVLKEWPAPDVARALGVNLATVYVTKHRVTTALAREARILAAGRSW